MNGDLAMIYLYTIILNVFIFTFMRRDQRVWIYDIFVVIPFSSIIIVIVRSVLKRLRGDEV